MENAENVLVLEDGLFAQSLAESYSETLIDTISSILMYLRFQVPSERMFCQNRWYVRCYGHWDVSKVISEDTFEQFMQAMQW